ncbi:hypothetical protein P7K49_009651 [Saguinus oedipus]|uniref:Uncharacterized protein n=1 Tax=Saguinus oedipus TaxID=9490 RepID=A0ABQ9VLD9_SAGOE|nr:hypothetical protein P7K49_009651 [Saguinus oedipus]
MGPRCARPQWSPSVPAEPTGSPVVSEEPLALLPTLDLRQEMPPPRLSKSFLSTGQACRDPLGPSGSLLQLQFSLSPWAPSEYRDPLRTSTHSLSPHLILLAHPSLPEPQVHPPPAPPEPLLNSDTTLAEPPPLRRGTLSEPPVLASGLLFQVLRVSLSLAGNALVSVYREVCSIRFLFTAVSLLSLFLAGLTPSSLFPLSPYARETRSFPSPETPPPPLSPVIWLGLLYLVSPLENEPKEMLTLSEYHERVRSQGQQLQQLQAELDKLHKEVSTVRAANSERVAKLVFQRLSEDFVRKPDYALSSVGKTWRHWKTDADRRDRDMTQTDSCTRLAEDRGSDRSTAAPTTPTPGKAWEPLSVTSPCSRSLHRPREDIPRLRRQEHCLLLESLQLLELRAAAHSYPGGKPGNVPGWDPGLDAGERTKTPPYRRSLAKPGAWR